MLSHDCISHDCISHDMTLHPHHARSCQQVYDACKLIPCMKIETLLFVEEEEKDFYEDDPDAAPAPPPNPNAPQGDAIYEQDLVTLRVTLTHENVPPPASKGKGKPPKEPLIPTVHAPYFPKTIREGWWLLLTDKSTPEGDNKQPLGH